MRIDESVLARLTGEDLRIRGTDFLKRVAFYVLGRPTGPLDCFLRYALSRALADGVKLFRPRAEDCRALEQTASNVGFGEYRQPYPAVVFEWPHEYTREQEANGRRLPPYTLAYHLPEAESVILSSFSCPDDCLVKVASSNYAQSEGGPATFATIEEALAFGGIQDAARHLEAGSLLLTRLSVNFELLLVNYGCRESGPADPTELNNFSAWSDRGRN